MGKGGGTSWPRPAVCLASVPRAQRPRRAAQNPLHEAPIPACAWTGSTLDLATSGLSSSPFPQASDRKARLLHVAWTSAYAPPPAAIPFTPSEGPGPPRTAVPWKDGPVCPPPATPARGCGAACGHVQRGARTDPVGLQASGGRPFHLPLGAWNPIFPPERAGGGASGSSGAGGPGERLSCPLVLDRPCSSHSDCLWLGPSQQVQ